MTGSMLVRHSQSSSLPVCGDGEIKLWDGYSMLHIEGNGRAHHQDLGKEGTIAGAVVVAQLAERLLPTPEIRGSNPDIGNKLFRMHICKLLSIKDENKEKEARNGPIFLKKEGTIAQRRSCSTMLFPFNNSSSG